MHANASNVQYEQVQACLADVEVTDQTEESNCHVHQHHDFLAPFFMNNMGLKVFFSACANEVSDDEQRKQNITQALRKLEVESTIPESPYFCPSSSANNWDEIHWTKRLYNSIRSGRYGEVYLTATGITFDELLRILKVDDIPKNVFPIRALPDLLFHQTEALVAARDDNIEGEGNEGQSSADEALEQAHQGHPLKGDDGDGPPKKLGKLLGALHVLLACKYLRQILNNKPVEKASGTKGLLLDKMIASVHVNFEASEEWICDQRLTLPWHHHRRVLCFFTRKNVLPLIYVN